jgi:hypothetical protein
MAEYMKEDRINIQEYYEKEKAIYNNRYKTDVQCTEEKKEKTRDIYFTSKARKQQPPPNFFPFTKKYLRIIQE